jgi:hypothetical protein
LDDSPKTKTAPPTRALLHFLVAGVLSARIAKLLRLYTVGMLLLVLRGRVVAVFAIAALQSDDFSHDLNSFPKSGLLLMRIVRSRKSQITR